MERTVVITDMYTNRSLKTGITTQRISGVPKGTMRLWCMGLPRLVTHSLPTSKWCRPLWTRTLTHEATPFLRYRLHMAFTSHLLLYFILCILYSHFCMYPSPPAESVCYPLLFLKLNSN